MSELFKPDIQEQILSVRREIAMREKVYPRWVASGKMKQHMAEREIRNMQAVLQTLEKVSPQNQVCAEILEIRAVYEEQIAGPSGLGTPGGLEHMGDVWSLLYEWEQTLRGVILLKEPT